MSLHNRKILVGAAIVFATASTEARNPPRRHHDRVETVRTSPIVEPPTQIRPTPEVPATVVTPTPPTPTEQPRVVRPMDPIAAEILALPVRHTTPVVLELILDRAIDVLPPSGMDLLRAENLRMQMGARAGLFMNSGQDGPHTSLGRLNGNRGNLSISQDLRTGPRVTLNGWLFAGRDGQSNVTVSQVWTGVSRLREIAGAAGTNAPGLEVLSYTEGQVRPLSDYRPGMRQIEPERSCRNNPFNCQMINIYVLLADSNGTAVAVQTNHGRAYLGVRFQIDMIGGTVQQNTAVLAIN
ncbi:hypothetical protein HY990_02525 [Candidatus Micrarchaeota archaeon]|nr:hypothetical protein [Candidatus Micrarchaeota archaeon]